MEEEEEAVLRYDRVEGVKVARIHFGGHGRCLSLLDWEPAGSM